MLEDILIPIFICVILPVAIVWIVMYTRQQEVKRKTEVMLKAIEAGVPVDTNLLTPDKKASKTVKQGLLDKLNSALITTLIGVALIVCSLILNVFLDLGDLNAFPFVAGAILIAIGISLFVTYHVGKKMLVKEIEAEEKALEQ